MKGVFIFEKRIFKNPAGIYFDPVFTDRVLSRYTSVVDELYIIARVDRLDLPDVEIEKKYSRITLPNVHVVEIDNVLSPCGLLKVPAMRRRILDCLSDADVVFVRTPTIWQQMVTSWAKKHGKRCILEVGADAWATYWHEGWKGRPMAIFMELSTKQVARSATHVLYVTERWLQEKYPTSGDSIACSDVDIDLQPDSVLEERLQKIRTMSGPLHLGTLASVSARSKGQDTIIKAIAFLKAKGRGNFVYHLAGPGDPTRLIHLAARLGVADNVRFDGLVHHSQIGDWFRLIDLYVLPSRQEGLPRALIEAMSFALPAFGARTGGIPELLPSSCIFRHDSSPVSSICSILESFSPDVLCRLSRANFVRAADFDAGILDSRRHDFFLSAIRGAAT